MSEALERMSLALESGKIFRRCDVPKGDQPSVARRALKILREVFVVHEETSWRKDLEGLRAQAQGAKSEPFPGGDSDPETTPGTPADSLRDSSADSTFVNRVLIALVEDERDLIAKRGARDHLVIAMSRFKGRQLHPLTNLRDAYGEVSVPTTRASAVRVHMTSIALRPNVSSCGDLLGALSEFERYVVAASEIATALRFEPFSPGETLGMFHLLANSSSLLSTKVREWERGRALYAGLTESVNPDALIRYLREELKLDGLERATAQRLASASLVGGAASATRVKAGGAPKRGSPQKSNTGRERPPLWVTQHPGLCMACEGPGHIREKCPAPKRPMELGPDNPIRRQAEYASRGNSKNRSVGAYLTTPLHAYRSGPVTPGVSYVVDTGASGVSYLPTVAGLDPRTVVDLTPPVHVGGISGETTVTKGGTAYMRAVCTDGTSRVFRFDAAVMPTLVGRSLALISPASFVHDGGFHSLMTLDPPPFGKGSTITHPKPMLLRVGAVDALSDPRQRAEIKCELDARTFTHAIRFEPLTAEEIAKHVPVEALATVRKIFRR